VSRAESNYIAIPLRAPAPPANEPSGIDLAIVIDTSAATEPSALAIARSMAASLLTHLGPQDRAALWAGDATLRAVAPGSETLTTVDREKRKLWLAGLARLERGGATDLGALLTEAASQLDPKRRGAVVYVGDGAPSVGELAPKGLRERMQRLPSTTRLLVAAVGSQPNLALLETLVRGSAVEQVYDAYGAARAALRLLEVAGRPLWLGAKVDLGPGVERILPRQLPPISADENLIVVGRVSGKVPTEFTLSGSGGVSKQRLSVRSLADSGDLRRRWGGERLSELINEGAGRASLVDIGKRFGLVSPFTSLYVPTQREMANEEEAPEDTTYEDRHARLLRWKPWASGGLSRMEPMSEAAATATMEISATENKEGGTGTRAKGEEGMLGGSARDGSEHRYAQQAPSRMLNLAPGGDAKRERRDAPRDEAPPQAPKPSMTAGAASAMPAPVAATAPPEPAPTELEARIPTSPEPIAPNGNLAEEAPAAQAFGGFQAGRGGGGIAGSKLGGLGSIGTTGSGHTTDAVDAARAKTAPKDADEPFPRPLALGNVGHERAPCGPAADLPLTERVVLWRERLANGGSVAGALRVYRKALLDCEASDWRERSALLVQIVDRLPSISDRVTLWRALLVTSPAAADAVYRFLLLRVQTAQDLKELHVALGLQRIDSQLLLGLLKKAQSPAERLAMLRSAAERFADDTELALVVLDAYEDAGDDAGGRAWARKLRRRVDATAHVRTSVGEYYLRVAKRGDSAAEKRDTEEARRTFGELVEFAPEDPLARRRLGDLLRSHGWYDEALRQYQTLAELTPDDPTVPLLLAAAAQGTGKIEEAVRWSEKAAATGSPDGSSSVALAARAMSSAFLAWAREDSARNNKPEEVERLRVRAARLAASESDRGVRLILTWSHPELRPALWTNALGALMPAADNLPLLGVAQAFVPATPAPMIELRLDPEDAARAARLGVKATLTAIVAEGTAEERIARLDIGFRSADGKSRDRAAVTIENGAVKEVTP
jgi:Ca-activated chloride channel family protein